MARENGPGGRLLRVGGSRNDDGNRNRREMFFLAREYQANRPRQYLVSFDWRFISFLFFQQAPPCIPPPNIKL
ncbi:hypothetical protein MTR_3g106460 [Medicago truncatula]|uniref:Uncharacterized protein n=1 Tax=Medicago truncatula TaxID=3880 RepID=G7JAE7_MEDTR|nr:hypothetical protein MTR_3g106460 [Medicago truncatula]